MGETTTFGVRMAKASNEETLLAVTVACLIEDLHKGYHPSPVEGAPLHFDPDDAEHLRALYDRLIELTEPHGGGLSRVAGTAHVVLASGYLDPDDDCVALHPQLRRGASFPDWLAYDHASDTLTIHGKRYPATLFCNGGRLFYFAASKGELLRADSEPKEGSAAPAPVAGDAVRKLLDEVLEVCTRTSARMLFPSGFPDRVRAALAQDRASQAAAQVGVPDGVLSLPEAIYGAPGYVSGAWSRRNWEAIQDDLRTIAAPTPAAEPEVQR